MCGAIMVTPSPLSQRLTESHDVNAEKQQEFVYDVDKTSNLPNGGRCNGKAPSETSMTSVARQQHLHLEVCRKRQHTMQQLPKLPKSHYSTSYLSQSRFVSSSLSVPPRIPVRSSSPTRKKAPTRISSSCRLLSSDDEGKDLDKITKDFIILNMSFVLKEHQKCHQFEHSRTGRRT